MNSLFIAFEGGDGTGKTTQAKRFKNRLTEARIPVLATREPTTHSPYGIEARQLLGGKNPVPPETLQQLFVKDRAWHLQNVILPTLAKDEHVITDRYLYSTIACGSLDLPCGRLIEMNRQFPLPDLTFIFQAPTEVCMERLSRSGRPLEIFENETKMRTIGHTYDRMHKLFPQAKIVYVNANRKEADIADEVFHLYTGFVNNPKSQKLFRFSHITI